jgi:membrane protease YdiL (CAAX protease family)
MWALRECSGRVRLVLRNWIRGLSPRAELALVWTVCFGYLTTRSVVVLIAGHAGMTLDTVRVVTGILVELALFGSFAWIARIRGWTPDRLGLRFTWPAALAGFPLYFAFFVIYGSMMSVLANFVRLPQYHVSISAPFWLLLAFIVINSFFEEITVSGYVIGALAHEGAALAVTASTLIRFAYHVYQGPIAALSVLPFGLLLGAVYWRWRTLAPLIVAHTLLNLISFFASRDAAAT